MQTVDVPIGTEDERLNFHPSLVLLFNDAFLLFL